MASLDNKLQWSEIDILKLLECMKMNIPSDDFRDFRNSQANLDWNNVAFGRFSGEMCKQKWMEISCNLRKYRTLTELVLESKELWTRAHKNNTIKHHPVRPKRPLTAYLRFYKEQRAKYCQMYPWYTKTQLAKVLAEKYNELPVEIKQKYVQDFKKEKRAFQEKMAQFKENHPASGHPKKSVVPQSHQTKDSKKSQGDMKSVKPLLNTEFPKTFSLPMKFQGEPRKPPMNAYHKFHQDSWSSPELRHLSFKDRWLEISRRWHRVPQDLKEHYSAQAEELQKQYWMQLDLWLKGLSPEECAAYKEARATCGKRKNKSMSEGRSPKFGRTDDLQSASEKKASVKHGEVKELLDPRRYSSETKGGHNGDSRHPCKI